MQCGASNTLSSCGFCHAALWLTLAPHRIHHEGQQHGDIGVDVVLIQVEQVHHCRHQFEVM